MNIVTYCSENYKDIFLKLFLPTWVQNSGTDKIILYTDGWNLSNIDAEYELSNVEIIEFFEKSTDWLVNTGRRYITLQDHFTNFPNIDWQVPQI